MRRLWGVLSAVFFLAAPAFAGLGQTVDSVKADREAMGGVMRSQTFERYTVHQITQPDGRMLREYVSPSGVVFGVVWEGPTMPNLSQALGAYFEEFQRAAAATSRRRGPLYVHSGALVVVSTGHMRSFQGFAYVTGLIPAGVTEAVLR